MRIDAIPIGKNPPHDINVVVEVPIGGEPIKYEMDKHQILQITHFFEHYKDLEDNKWVKVVRIGEADEARTFIERAVQRALKAPMPEQAVLG